MLEQLKPTIMTGALAAAGAWISRSVGSKVGAMVNVQPGSMTNNLLTAAVGVVLGTVVGKVLKKPEIGTALGVGAVAISALNLIGTVTPQQTAGMGVLTAEAAPYYQAVATPPVASFPSVSNLYTDAGAPVIV